jgi:hypothetical protein
MKFDTGILPWVTQHLEKGIPPQALVDAMVQESGYHAAIAQRIMNTIQASLAGDAEAAQRVAQYELSFEDLPAIPGWRLGAMHTAALSEGGVVQLLAMMAEPRIELIGNLAGGLSEHVLRTGGAAWRERVADLLAWPADQIGLGTVARFVNPGAEAHQPVAQLLVALPSTNEAARRITLGTHGLVFRLRPRTALLVCSPAGMKPPPTGLLTMDDPAGFACLQFWTGPSPGQRSPTNLRPS